MRWQRIWESTKDENKCTTLTPAEPADIYQT